MGHRDGLLASQSIRVHKLVLVLVWREEITRNRANVVTLQVHLRWVTGGDSVEIEGVFTLHLAVNVSVHCKPRASSTKAHSVHLVESHCVGEGTRGKTGLLFVFVILMAGGLEGHGRLATRRKTGTSHITGGEICACNRWLTRKTLGPDGLCGCVGDLIEIEEGVDVGFVASIHIGRVFRDCSHGDSMFNSALRGNGSDGDRKRMKSSRENEVARD